MIPQFPEFKKIEHSDRAAVEAHTSRFEPYSDFNFNCLIAWNPGGRMIAELHDNLVVQFTDYESDELFLSFLGENSRDATIRSLITHCKKHDLPTTLRLMPEISIQDLEPEVFSIQESRIDFDYIYAAQDLVDLSGSKFQEKRGHERKFWRDNPGAKLIRLDLSTLDHQRAILTTFNEWEQVKVAQSKDSGNGHELEATKRLLTSDGLEKLIALGLFLPEGMCGYAIGEELPRGHALVHFMKSTNAKRGMSEALMRGYAENLLSRGISHMNVESDLGVDYIRKSKMSWQPSSFLKRYDVRSAQL